MEMLNQINLYNWSVLCSDTLTFVGTSSPISSSGELVEFEMATRIDSHSFISTNKLKIKLVGAHTTRKLSSPFPTIILLTQVSFVQGDKAALGQHFQNGIPRAFSPVSPQFTIDEIELTEDIPESEYDRGAQNGALNGEDGNVELETISNLEEPSVPASFDTSVEHFERSMSLDEAQRDGEDDVLVLQRLLPSQTSHHSTAPHFSLTPNEPTILSLPAAIASILIAPSKTTSASNSHATLLPLVDYSSSSSGPSSQSQSLHTDAQPILLKSDRLSQYTPSPSVQSNFDEHCGDLSQRDEREEGVDISREDKSSRGFTILHMMEERDMDSGVEGMADITRTPADTLATFERLETEGEDEIFDDRDEDSDFLDFIEADNLGLGTVSGFAPPASQRMPKGWMEQNKAEQEIVDERAELLVEDEEVVQGQIGALFTEETLKSIDSIMMAVDSAEENFSATEHADNVDRSPVAILPPSPKRVHFLPTSTASSASSSAPLDTCASKLPPSIQILRKLSPGPAQECEEAACVPPVSSIPRQASNEPPSNSRPTTQSSSPIRSVRNYVPNIAATAESDLVGIEASQAVEEEAAEIVENDIEQEQADVEEDDSSDDASSVDEMDLLSGDRIMEEESEEDLVAPVDSQTPKPTTSRQRRPVSPSASTRETPASRAMTREPASAQVESGGSRRRPVRERRDASSWWKLVSVLSFSHDTEQSN
jgi:hypothetical protein